MDEEDVERRKKIAFYSIAGVTRIRIIRAVIGERRSYKNVFHKITNYSYEEVIEKVNEVLNEEDNGIGAEFSKSSYEGGFIINVRLFYKDKRAEFENPLIQFYNFEEK